MQITINWQTANRDKFQEDVLVNNPDAEFQWSPQGCRISNSAQSQAALQVLADNHDPDTLTTEQQEKVDDRSFKNDFLTDASILLDNIDSDLLAIQGFIDNVTVIGREKQTLRIMRTMLINQRKLARALRAENRSNK